MDEKDINIGGGKSPHIVTSRKKISQVVTPERSQTITVLGCGNASGSNIPPYFVFPGKRMLPELMNGAIYLAVMELLVIQDIPILIFLHLM